MDDKQTQLLTTKEQINFYSFVINNGIYDYVKTHLDKINIIMKKDTTKTKEHVITKKDTIKTKGHVVIPFD